MFLHIVLRKFVPKPVTLIFSRGILEKNTDKNQNLKKYKTKKTKAYVNEWQNRKF